LAKGAIRYFGVSNFDVGDMKELFRLKGGDACASNQVVYNLKRRGIESGLMPWSREQEIPIMAYSPIEQGRLGRDRTLAAIAARHAVTPSQIALAWVLRQGDMMVIPKSSNATHVRENHAALDITLSEADLVELDGAFPPPKGARPLEIL
jgi:diketogulonate reductase-like aldo/keto reductase